ncbi:neprilysin-1-like [Amblyomma americanum]
MVVGFALFLVIIYFVLRALSSPASRDSLCSSDDCLDHARQLLQSLDTSVDPCAHFHAYVCGHKAVLHREAVDDLQYAMLVVSSASRAVTPSPPLNGAFPAASKAMAALSTCLEVSSAQSAEPFVSFMKARGMLWPAERLKANLKLVDVLDVLLDLTINWRVVLWFDVKRTYLTEDYGLVVVFGEPGPLPVLRMRQVSTLDGVAYANVVKGVSHFLTNGKIQLSDPSIQTLRADENAVRSALLSAPVDEHDVLLPLHRVHQLFNEKLSLNELLGVIGKHLKSISGVSLETKILIVRRHSLTQLLSLFEVISPTRLFSVISWMFSYAYVWMLNTGFGSLAAVEAENTSDLVQCFLAVHESFGIVQASPLFHALFDADSLKDEVFAVFNSTSKALTNMLQASEMISNLTKKEAALKIGAHIRVRLLPPEAFMADDVLDMLYVNFPGGGNRTFFDTWLKSKEVLKATLPDPFHDRLLTARYRRMSGSASYFYSLNLVWLGLSALLPPLYRSRGSALMTYSGLGYQFARQLVRAADERGRKMDYSGLDISWWEQHGSCALDAAQTAEEKATVTDLFALDVALEALKTSGHDLSSLRIKQMEEFSPTQMFYISYCSHFCDSPAGPDECDLAINASDFANAFGCQREAARTCLFA